MGLHQIKPPRGARRSRRRRGLGDAAGQGSYSGRGFKGQKKRGSVSPFFEGGQLKLIKRLPYMRGFNNVFRVEFVGINLDRLSTFGENAEVTPEALVARGFVNKPGAPLKILGTGEAPRGLKVSAHAFSASARAKIEAAGGAVTLLGPQPEPKAESNSTHARARRAKEAAGKKAPPQDEPKSESGKDS
ncbi:MAG: 50S ribosomal protein L15 [SAR202 cluster bacterium]|nr:50S ribosomal protein L15 [SAR202 cluster bacterium]